MNDMVASADAIEASLPVDLERELLRAHSDWDAAQGTVRLWRSSALVWLDAIPSQLSDLSKFQALSAEVKEDGFTHVLVVADAGMGLLSRIFRSLAASEPGWPELVTIDSADPGTISSIESRIDLNRTLFFVLSKSGTSRDLRVLLSYFLDRTKGANRFIAVTDRGSHLDALAAELVFRRTYYVETPIDERYSAFSDLGLISQAAAGYDTEAFLLQGSNMREHCREAEPNRNPGVSLGLLLSSGSKSGRNKVTLVSSRRADPLAEWVSNLLCGVRGSQGPVFVAVHGEPLTNPESYGDDRMFVHLDASDDADTLLEQNLSAIESAGHPVIRIPVNGDADLGRVAFQWEFAITVAAAALGIPFARPDRNETSDGGLESQVLLVGNSAMQLFAGDAAARVIFTPGDSLGSVIRNHLDRLLPGDHLEIFARIPSDPRYKEILQGIRKQIVEAKQVATVLHYSMRSPEPTEASRSSLILEVSCGESTQEAWARGDRVLRVHLGPDVAKGLPQLSNLICAAVEH